MTATTQIPRVTDITGAATTALAASRPSAAQHIATGRWGDPIAMWKAQITLALRRLADECRSGRVPLAEGKALAELVASEFDAATDPSPQKAIGLVEMLRHNTTAVAWPGGLIRAGTKFSRAADPTKSPRVRAAQYETLEPFYVDSMIPAAWAQVSLKVRAIQAGTAANIQAHDAVLTIADTLFDTNSTVSTSRAAGGSDGVSVAKLRSLAQAASLGQYGPTTFALAAGCLLTSGVSRVAIKEYPGTTYTADCGGCRIWLCDDSWCWSSVLADSAKQRLNDSYLGFGCKAAINEVINLPVSLAATVLLRDRRYVADTVEISDNIRAACLSYFNDRPDWWTWRERSIAARIVGCDRRILSVPTTITLTDTLTGSGLAPPSAELPISPGYPIYHYDLDTTNVGLTFVTPSGAY